MLCEKKGSLQLLSWVLCSLVVKGARVASVQLHPQATEGALLKPRGNPSGKGREWEKRGMESKILVCFLEENCRPAESRVKNKKVLLRKWLNLALESDLN